MTVLALTVRQPWASAIIEGGKTVENRTWRTGVRGRIAIHAGGQLDLSPRGNAAALDRAWGGREGDDFDRGVILGTVQLVDCHLQGYEACRLHECDDNLWAEWSYRELGQRPTFHWLLTEPRQFVTPIKAKGALQLWQPGPSVSHLIETAEVMP